MLGLSRLKTDTAHQGKNYAASAAIVNDLIPELTTRPGIGPVSAAQAIVSFSHAGRCRNDAAFAKLAGTSPIEASSGQTNRHRLDRGGDRALNRAIHTIANTRMRSHPSTQDYLARRRAERQIRSRNSALPQAIHRPPAHRALTAAMNPNTTASA